MTITEEGHRILREARATLAGLKDSKQRFAAEREEIEALRSTRANAPVERQPHIETRNERHRREITEQEEQFERSRRQRRREERREKVADWSAWNDWCDHRIAEAIAEERRKVCAAIGNEVRAAIDEIYRDIGEHVKELRVEILNLQATLHEQVKELRCMVKPAATVIDMQHQQQRRAN